MANSKTNSKTKSVDLDAINKETEETKEVLTPAEYFEKLKSKVGEESSDRVAKIYDVTLQKLKKFMLTGQKAAAKALYAKALYLEKEAKLMEKGVTKYVERSVIEGYIDKITDDCVCITEMCNYERDIPDEIVDRVTETMDIFDEFFVIFTDYTGEKRLKVAKERREKDPILFGNIFIDGRVSPKFYVIGDWVDDFCDLTLDKMIEETAKKKNIDKDSIVYTIEDSSSLDDIETALFGTKRRKTEREKETK